MKSGTVLRISAVSGAILYFAAGAVLGQPPTGGASGQEVASWFAGHVWPVRASVWLSTMEAIVMATFLGIARNRLPAPHRDIFLIGGASFVAETAVSTWIWAALSWHSTELAPQTARTLLDVTSFWGPVLNGSTIAMLAPVVVLSWGRNPVLPRWLGIVGGVALVEQAVESVVTTFGDSGFTEPGGAMNLLLGAGLDLIWIVCLGFALSTRSQVGSRLADAGSTLTATS